MTFLLKCVFLVVYVQSTLGSFTSFGYPQDISQVSGDSCKITDTQTNGTCRPLSDCQAAKDALEKQERPQICSYEGDKAIVCCTDQIKFVQRFHGQSDILPTQEKAVQIAESMCECYKDYDSPSVSDCEKPAPGHIRSRISGYDYDDLLIIRIKGGVNANSREFPHMVALGYPKMDGMFDWSCGGSLISSSHVLTAAHCLARTLPSVVRVGDINLRDDGSSDNGQQISVSGYVVYPNYTTTTYYDDIAILSLNGSVKFTEYAKPACLNTEPISPNVTCVATGWGTDSWQSTEGSEDLKKVNLVVESSTVCNETFWGRVKGDKLKWGVNDTMLCAGDPERIKDTCTGDSGGPIQIQSTTFATMFNIIGVTSFGDACAETTSPAIYTRVSKYIPWIVSIVWPQKIV